MTVKYPIKGQHVYYVHPAHNKVVEAIVESSMSFDKMFAVLDEDGRRKLLYDYEMFTDRESALESIK
jgi:hypothetical protein